MPHEGGRPVFRGDGTDNLNPRDFLRAVRSQFLGLQMKEEEKVDAFDNHLVAGTPAEKWYTKLNPTSKERTVLKDFEKAFLAQWPSFEEEEALPEVKAAKLAAHLDALKEEDLGTKVLFNGSSIAAHRAWAAKAKVLAADAGVTGADYVSLAMSKMPRAIKRALRTRTFTTFVDFATAVQDVDMAVIQDAVEDRQQYEQSVERAKAKASTSMDDIAAALGRLSIGPVPPAPPAAAPAGATRPAARAPPVAVPTPVQGPGARYVRPQAQGGATNRRLVRGPAVMGAAQRVPATDEERQRMRALLTALPHARDNTTWQEQVRVWHQQYPDGVVRWDRPYPLQPHTAGVCTGECFRCGMSEHLGSQCPVAGQRDQWISKAESDWRNLCNSVFGPFRRGEEAPVFWTLDEGDAGNAEGPSN
ncbi:hypothetical protein GGG16DRAFT_110975 [Schizophyllum commune]